MRALIVGTGPSLRKVLHLLRRFDGLVFTCNNTFEDAPTDVWLSCDPSWHAYYSPVRGDFDKWHWDSDICNRYGYKYVEGVWMDGLCMEPGKISLNHCSGAQLLNLAVNQYACDEVVLIGHDFSYPQGEPRHYFTGLSSEDGEYPSEIRKFSKFDKQGQGDDLLQVYKRIAATPGIPPIYNATDDSALPWFPHRDIRDFLHEPFSQSPRRMGIV